MRLSIGCLVLGTILSLQASLRAQVVVFTDSAGDATPRRTDDNADGPFDPELQQLPDLLSIELSSFAPTAPHIDHFEGMPDDAGGFIRIDVIFAGLVNPPGRLGYDIGEPYSPDQYGPNPVLGYIEFDMDGNENTGGDLDDTRFRYLGNVARFGGLPSEPRFQGRAASIRDDIDYNLLTEPDVERSGEEFHIAMLDERIEDIDVIIENPSGAPGAFDEGETWQCAGKFFHRAHVYDEFTVSCQSGDDRYEPELLIQFAHDVTTDRTTISLVIPKTNAAAALLDGPGYSPEPNDGCDYNQYSIEEAVTDMIVSATVADPFTRMLPEFQLIADWEFQTAGPALDVANWRVSACLGTAYLPVPVDGDKLIWSDVYPDVVNGDVNGDGVVDGSDQTDIDAFISANDGVPYYDDDGDNANGVVDWHDWGRNFCVYDVNYDGFIDGFELATAALGDMNLDGNVDGRDIPAFMLALLDPTAYDMQYPGAQPNQTGDINGDGTFDLGDLAGFVALLVDA